MIYKLTGYYYGSTLFIVFYLPGTGKYAHCSAYGFTIENSAAPFCGYGY